MNEEAEHRFGSLWRAARLTVLLVVAVTGCAKGKNPGPGLPACSRTPATATCTATWTGANSGSMSCSQLSWQGSGGWSFTLDGTNVNQVTAGASLSSAPAAGQSFTMEQFDGGGLPLIQLDAAGSWWGATPNIGGQMLLHVDETVPGSAFVHGSLAGSLVKGSGGTDQGVQICIVF
jgi:hypothetical protein